MNAVLVQKPDEFIPTRQSLLCRLKDSDDQESWREFFETYWKLIYTTALKAGLSEAEAQDVVQETVISVARKIPEFRYDPQVGSFKHWLMKLTAWRITDQRRRRMPVPESPPKRPGNSDRGTALIDTIADPQAFDPSEIWDREWERNLMDVAISRVKAKVDAKQFQLFDLYVFQEWPMAQIVETLGVSAARVYVAKHRISRLIQKQIKALEVEMQQPEKSSR